MIYHDPRAKDTLAPLLLRLALAAVFIYHGADKVFGAPENNWGTTWAKAYWAKLATPTPGQVSDTVNALASEPATQFREIYAANAPPMPAALRSPVVQLAVAWGELVGGVALLLGLLTRVAAAGLVIIQLGAVFTVTGYQGFSMFGGAEFTLALTVMGLCLMLMGGGSLAVDRLLSGRKKAQVSTPAPVPVEVGAGH
jgi:uncharacterized membrane protein YphA (DoxX/SURF4 family)